MSFQGHSPVMNESVSAVTAANSVDVGTLRTYNGEEYVYVYNNGNSVISPGLAAVVTAVSGYSVTVSSVSGQFAVGFCKHATITTGAYGWLLTRGFVSGLVNNMASTALASGVAFQLDNDGKICNGTTGPFIGAVMVAMASAGTGGAGFIRGYGS